MKKIKPVNMELGQIVFGNPVGEYECPEWIEALLAYLFEEIDRIYWNKYQKEWNRYDDPEIEDILYRPYYWGEDEKQAEMPNFEFEGVEVRWYKNFGRGTTINTEMTENNWIKWFNKCLKKVRQSDVSL